MVRDARSLGIPRGALPLLLEAHDLAMTIRDSRVEDDHHPDYLHPGRTALIAMTDGEVRDPEVLCAIILFDSVRSDLVPSSSDILEVCGPGVEVLRGSLPSGDLTPDRLIEEILALQPPTAVAVLAEALDHARHVHVGASGDRMRATLEQVTRGYRPVAERVSPVLASRLEHWARHFRKRLL